jgi:alpha-glucosidase
MKREKPSIPMENQVFENKTRQHVLKNAQLEQTDGSFNMLNPVITTVPERKKEYLEEIKTFWVSGNNFYFSDGDSTVCVSVVSDKVIRIRLAPMGTFLDDFSYAIHHNQFKVSKIEFSESVDRYLISTGTISCEVIKKDFLIRFLDAEENVLNEDAHGMHWEENTDFGGYYVYCSKRFQTHEHFFGLGDKPTNLDLKGKRFELWGSDTYAFEFGRDPLYKNIPFYVGIHHNKAYGIFFDNTYKTNFDFAHEDPDKVSFWADGGEINYYFIYGPHMMDVVKRYAQLTGTHPMPPMWALGYQQSRWSYFPESKVKELAATFRERKIPCDALYLDIDYMEGYRCFTWSSKYFPDPRRMIKDLQIQGFKTVVIIDPGIKVDENYWVFKEGSERKVFCKRSDDYLMEGHVWPGKCQFPDFTNANVREWWSELFQEMVEFGVAGVWCDMNEPAVFGMGTFPNDVRHQFDGHRGSHRKAHNVYGMQMVRATYMGLRKFMKNKRPLTITRSGYAGVQRYSSTWTGDNVATWEHLKLAATMCVRLSTSGISFCGSDIGGFTGEPDGELYTRWIQLGIFHPFMRTHSAGDTRPREPWSFGEFFEDIIRKFIELRYRLIPYIYSVFWEHHKYGFPMLRPISMFEQEVETNLYREDEFTFGNKILVCPVMEQGATGRMVYIPHGNWYNFWTHELIHGGQEFYIEASIHTMPLFMRAGAVIPEYPVMQYVGEKPIGELMLNVYYANYQVNSYMYEDHGDTFGYEQEIYVEKKFSVEGAVNSITVEQTEEGMYTPRYDTYKIKFIGLPFEPHLISVDGINYKAADLATSDEHRTYRIRRSFSVLVLQNGVE